MTDTTKKAFVIMPFDAELNEVYSGFLAPILSTVGFAVRRADDIFSHQNILRDIVESIAGADLIVADLTDLNPNVFYELGVAHALRKKVILLAQDIDKLPFDLRSYRIVPYDTHFARIEQARGLLREIASGAFNGSIEFGNPVTDFLRTSGQELSDVLGRESNASDRPPPAGDEAEDRGWLDYLASMEEGLDRLTTILGEITRATTQSTEDVTRYGDLVQRARNSTEPNVNARVRLITSEYARTLADYGQRLATSNTAYETAIEEIQDSIEFVIRHGTINDENDRIKLGEFITTLQGMEGAAVSARDAYSQSRGTLRALEGVESNLTRAAKVVGREMDRLVDNTDKTVAAVRRGVEVGTRRLEHEHQNRNNP